jgi:diamine N-acetyltransferase
MPSEALSGLTIRQAGVADAARLSVLARTTFVDTFGAQNTVSDMAMYTAASFGEDIQRAELQDERNTVIVAEQDEGLVGYALLRDGRPPLEITATRPIEIDRLYVAKEQIGTGLGATLMQRCLDEAARLGHDVVWLNVWEHNVRALRFYERWGFESTGMMPYILGTDRQMDYVMVRRVGAA